MGLPKQVEQQLKEVEELERSLTAQPEAAQPDEPTAQPDEQPSAEPTQPTNVVELKQPEPDQTDWQQKYKSLQGHFDREVPRLHQQNKELAQQLQAMQEQIAKLQQPAQAPADERLVTDADKSAFGDDLIDLQTRVAKQVMREFVTPLQAELKARDEKIAALEQRLTQTGGEVYSMTFEQKLHRAVPDFEAINNSQPWVDWLNEVDPLTGEPRRAYASYVYEQGDVDKVKKVVDLFKSMTKAPDTSRAQRDTELNRQIQPTRTASASTPAPQGDRIYTEAEMNRLWDKVRQLSVQGKVDEAFKLDAELSAAMMQGRVRG